MKWRFIHTHKADMITIEEKLENLTLLLNEKSITKTTIANLPTNSETFTAIIDQMYESTSKEVMYNKVNELCVVKWFVGESKYQWYIGYIKQEVENRFVIDHLQRISEKTNPQLANPSSEDIKIADKQQVLHCKVEGEWNVNDPRNIRVCLEKY